MKRILIIALPAIALFSSCSKDESNITPTNGQYVSSAEPGLLISLVLKDGKCTDFDIYTNGERFKYTPENITTKGEYPKYRYHIDDLTIKTKFSGLNNFTGTLKGALEYAFIDENTHTHGKIAFNGENPMTFILDNTPLDANSDGILDI